MDEIIKRDQNFVTTLAGVTNDSDKDITMLRVDPITKRLLINATGIPSTSPGGPTGSIQYNNSGVFGGSSNATLDSSGNMQIDGTFTAGGNITSQNGGVFSAYSYFDDGSGNMNIFSGGLVFNSSNYSLLSALNTLDDGHGNTQIATSLIVNSNNNSVNPSFAVKDISGSYALQVNNTDTNGYGDYVKTLFNVLDDGTGQFNINSGQLYTTNYGLVATRYNTLDDGGGGASFAGTGSFAGGNFAIDYAGSLNIGLGNILLNETGDASFTGNAIFAGGTIGFNAYGWYSTFYPVAIGGSTYTDNNAYLSIGLDGSIGEGNTRSWNITPSGVMSANSFVTSGGSSSQFVKGDGSLDSTTYVSGTPWTSAGYLVYKATGTATLVSGTKAITISGLTSSNHAFITVSASGGTLGTTYKAVCTTNTLTITSIGPTGSTVTTDTSTLNYLVI